MSSGSRQASPSDAPAGAREYEYLTPEKLAVAESITQQLAIEVLVQSLRELGRRRGWSAKQVGTHLFFAWKPDEPLTRIAPDVYLLAERPPKPPPDSWQTWLPNQHPPRWAAEVVSQDWGKDYRRAPDHYAQLGCRELVLFDPAAAGGQTRNKARAALTIYRRADDGAFRRTYAGPGPAYSDELGCWLLPRADGYGIQLRLSEDEEGRRILPTGPEQLDSVKRHANAEKRRAVAEKRAEKRRADAEKGRADAEKRRADAERRRADAEAAARAAAEARVRELEAARKGEVNEPNE